MKPATERFWAKVNKNGAIVRAELGACWVWIGSVNRSDYGVFNPDGGRGLPVTAHRWSYKNSAGGIAAGLQVLHRCDNRPCVRPSHLFEGTNADNRADMMAKGRQAVGERIGGAKLTADQVREIRRLHPTVRPTYRATGRRFGISGSVVRQVALGLLWRHVK